MRAPSTAQIGRTAFTLVYLVALAASGAPGLATVVLGVALVAAWAAPMLLRKSRCRRRQGTAVGQPAAVAEAGMLAA
jgi:hypothetical protein